MTGLECTPEAPALMALTAATEEGAKSACVDRLDRLGVQLQQASRQIESAVMDVCERFSNIASKARSETERLLKLFDSDGMSGQSKSFESLLQVCNRTLAGTLDSMLDMQNNSNLMISEAVQHLCRIDVSAGKIDGALTELNQISHGNRLLALNARIEAAHSPQRERGFNAIAVELASQTERTNRLTEGVGELSASLRSLAEAAVGYLERVQAEATANSQKMHEEVDARLRDLESLYETLRSAVSHSQKESSGLAAEIHEAVRGLQFQDRISQQVAHVVHDLKVIRDNIAGEFPDGALEFSGFAMHEERTIHGALGQESPEGDVELF